MKVSEVLEQAANLIAVLGWCQECYAKKDNGTSTEFWDPEADAFDIEGAIGRVLFETEPQNDNRKLWEWFRKNKVETLLPTYVDTGQYTIESWNDVEERTKEQAIQTLRDMAANARKREKKNEKQIKAK